MATTTLTKPSIDLMINNAPIYTVESKQYVTIDIFRGSDSDNIEGISWWTTAYSTALIYANMHNGFIQHRRITIPVEHGFLVNPNQYLLGGRPQAKGNAAGQVSADIEHYYYGIDELNMKISDLDYWHFRISIHETLLNAMSYEVARYEKTELPAVPGKTITLSF